MLDLRKRWLHLILHSSLRSGRRARLTRWSCVALATLALPATACRQALRGLGPSGAALERNADQLFGAFVIRYTQVARDHKYELARNQLNRNALVPSRVFDDTTIWTSMPSPVLRALLVEGTEQGGRYEFTSRAAVPRPARPGDSRHFITLARLGPNEFVWDTMVDFALGTVSAADVGALTTALLGSAEHGSESEIRADYRSVAPRAAAALGQLFSLDSIRATPYSDGTSDVRLTIGLHTDALKERLPAFADYIAKYANPAHYRLAVTDRTGTIWFDVEGADRQFSIHYRAGEGRLVPLFGAARQRPDTLELHVDFTTKLKLFTVGLRNLVTDFIITDTPHERAWTFIARREPEWKLPLITVHLIRTPLRRPFEGTGVIFHVGVRDSAESQTLLERRAHATVQESTILRFLNSLGSGAMSDLADRTEREEEQFLRDVFAGLQADARALATSLGSAPVAEPATEKASATNP
ncbi:MAG TPA: hypothetical protein VH539_12535 [Gemmatimonadaceae bacterium]